MSMCGEDAVGRKGFADQKRQWEKKKGETVAVNTLRELKAPDSCITTVLLAVLILTFLASHRVLRWVPHLNIH